MQGRRTRGRPRRDEDVEVIEIPSGGTGTLGKRGATRASPSRRGASPTRRVSPTRRAASPSRRASPGRTRRSSRPRSSASAVKLTKSTPPATVVPPSPIQEVKESPKISPKARTTSIPIPITHVTTRGQLDKSSSSMYSAFSTSTQETVEIRSSSSAIDAEISKLSDYIRRSVSKTIAGATRREGTHTPTTNTEAESRYSRSVSRSVYDDDNYFKAEFSDNENTRVDDEHEEDNDVEDNDNYKSFVVTHMSYSTSALGQVCRQLEIPREFGGWIGASLLMLLGPCLVYYLQWCCEGHKAGSGFKWPQLEFSMTHIMRDLFRSEAVCAFVIFNFGVFVLSAVMFGKYVRLPTEQRHGAGHKFCALPIGVLLSMTLAAAEYLKWPAADFVLKHYLHFCLYGFVNAFVLAFWCYLRSNRYQQKSLEQLNIYGRSGNYLIDYAVGRQINPKWLNFVNFKQVFYCISLLTTLLYAECFIYKNVRLPSLPILPTTTLEQATDIGSVLQFYANVRYNPAALLTATMLLLYVCDAIIFEHHLVSSFELQGEGLGCLLLLRYAATPYLLCAVAKYFFEQRIAITCRYGAYVGVMLLLAGLTLKRFSSALKYKYRVNPAHQIFNGFETIHTYQGKRLLLGSMWGSLRQPNYTGDILALCGLAVPIFLHFAWPPLLSVLLIVAILVHRVFRVNAHNASRYHSSWVRYRARVPYYLVPKIF